MKIAIISKLWEKSDPLSTGGTGVLVGALAEGLMQRGHRVTLFATGDSRTRARLVSVLKRPFSPTRPYSEIYEYLNIAEAFRLAGSFDIINCHVEHKSLIFSSIVKTPVVHTIGYGEFFGDELALLKRFRHQPFIAVSQAVARKFNFLNFRATIPIGLDNTRMPFNDRPKDYFLFLARLSPQKGPDAAIAAAKKAGVKLILAGKTNSTDKTYLEKKIFPHIDGKQIIYVGEVNFKLKIKLLKNACALIHPHSYFEAFGISMLEAQLCGTPVIAYPTGATAEVVENNRSGFIVKNPDDISKAIKKIDTINRNYCRQRAEKLFSLERMVSGYEKTFKQLIHEK